MCSRKVLNLSVWIGLHLLFWAFTVYFFVSFAILRPRVITNAFGEILCVGLIAAAVYLNYFILYPYFFKKSQFKYWILTFVSIIIISGIEIYIFRRDIIFVSQTIKTLLHYASVFLVLRNLAFILFFLLLKHYQQTKKTLEREIKHLQEEALWKEEKYEIEQQYLRSKIAPHFLYNIINYLLFCSLENKSNLSDLLHKLASILDYYMIGSSKETVAFSQEMIFYQNFIALENNRYQQSVDVNMDIIGDHDTVIIAPLLFECFIANAFKFTPHDGSGYIKIVFDFTQKQKISFSCINNKQKVTKRHNMVSSKNGLKFTQKRLHLLYKDHYFFQINENERHFEVKLEIDLL